MKGFQLIGEEVFTRAQNSTVIHSLRRSQASLDTLAEEINAEYRYSLDDDRCRAEYARSSVEHARRCGELLLKVKGQLKHGTYCKWLPWLKANCPDVGERMAQHYMKIASDWDIVVEKTKHVSDLSLRAVIELLTEHRAADDSAVETDPVDNHEANLAANDVGLGPGEVIDDSDGDTAPGADEQSLTESNTTSWTNRVQLILHLTEDERADFVNMLHDFRRVYGTKMTTTETVLFVLGRAHAELRKFRRL